MGEEKVEETKDDELDGPKLSPSVPEKVLKMWFVEDKKANFEVKKVSEIRSAKAITEWNCRDSIITNSVGKTLQVYKTYSEAAQISITRKIEFKRTIWEQHAKATMMLNDQIADLYDQLESIRNSSNEEKEKTD